MGSRRGLVKEGASPVCVDASGANELEGKLEEGEGVIPLGRRVGWSRHTSGEAGPQSSGCTAGQHPAGADSLPPAPAPPRECTRGVFWALSSPGLRSLVWDVGQLSASIRLCRPELWAFCLTCIIFNKAGCPLSLDPIQGHEGLVSHCGSLCLSRHISRKVDTVECQEVSGNGLRFLHFFSI